MTTWYPAQPITLGLDAWDLTEVEEEWLAVVARLAINGKVGTTPKEAQL